MLLSIQVLEFDIDNGMYIHNHVIFNPQPTVSGIGQTIGFHCIGQFHIQDKLQILCSTFKRLQSKEFQEVFIKSVRIDREWQTQNIWNRVKTS